MINPFNLLLDRQEQQAAGADLLLATVAAVTSGGLTLIPDGETEATRKKYKYMTSAYPAPAAGDRVVVMRLSGTYVVLGRIGTSTPEADQYVRRSGDTMTGALGMADSDLVIDASNITLGTKPASTQLTHRFRFRDSKQASIARILGAYSPAGQAGLQLYADNYVDGQNVYNYLGVFMGETGIATVAANHPEAWRSMLGLGSNGALPITVAQGGTGQSGVTVITDPAEVFVMVSGFTCKWVNYAVWGKLAMLTAMLAPVEAVTTSDWTKWATLVAGKRPLQMIAANITRTSYCTIDSNGSINVGATVSANGNQILSATYLLA